MKLHYKKLGHGQPFVILHGLFGCADNWQTHAKKLSEYYQVFSIDLRNHGHSPWSDEFSLQTMSDDLWELFKDMCLKKAIVLGHSMGGKVAMTFAQQHAILLEKLIVVDIGIKQYPPHHHHILKAITTLKLEEISSRTQADQHLAQQIKSTEIRQFLLKNLYWKDNKLAWRMNVDAIQPNIYAVLEEIKQSECVLPTLFIRGGASNYILDEDILAIENAFIDCDFVTIPDAGHWVHAEQPETFINAVLSFCLR